MTATTEALQDSTEVVAQARRRRTFAIISHPDAGKSTLTEALALHAKMISEAGAVHGKGDRRSTVSDWLDMEKARGISITSTALQFEYADTVVNLLDTPGHADFSEDTYRVLAVVDVAVMLVDAAKGLEPQTLKLFEVCRHSRTPVITVVNKWDRPGRSALELLDEIEHRIGLKPTPLTWPVGMAGDFRGVLNRSDSTFSRFTRTPGGRTMAGEDVLSADDAQADQGADWAATLEEHDLLSLDGSDHDQGEFLAARTTPVLFTSAVLNFGVRHVLDALVDLAPAPAARPTESGGDRDLGDDFSAVVFKMQAGMDSAHRDRLAFARICSGRFDRGMVVTSSTTGRSFATKYAHSVFGRERTVTDVAYPGDVVGLVNAGALAIGDTLYVGRPVTYRPIPRFTPEHFMSVRARDSGRYKQFRRGLTQLDQEGVVHVLRSDLRGEQQPVLAAVGPMQFEVVTHRMSREYGVEVATEHLDYSVARRVSREQATALAGQNGAEVLAYESGELLAIFTDLWRLRRIARERPELGLDPDADVVVI
uniref:Peptide chain release factor 3 n=1 Tax=uncultured Nocardioidaceae bacterium TaxID=253824 RepID=A0A6J4LYS3_9ACTN|nr:MAG: Peptide chain release factor 3 [uncultured Nocardioidaceae bacterium]